MKILLSILALCLLCVISSQAISFIPPPPGNECKAPNGNLGLGRALREIVDLIPFPKLTMIYFRAVSNDPEVQAAMEYIDSTEFKAIVKTIHETKEFAEILEYICNELYFNAYFYLNALEDVLGFPVMPKPSHHHQMSRNLLGKSRSGFEGYKNMLKKLRDVHVDVDKILKNLSNFFGWKIQT